MVERIQLASTRGGFGRGSHSFAQEFSYQILYVCNIVGPLLFLWLAQAQEKILLALKSDSYGKEEEKTHNCVYLLGTLRQL